MSKGGSSRIGKTSDVFERAAPTESVCPECLARIPAARVVRDGNIYLEKTCPQDGEFCTIIWRGADSFKTWVKPKNPFIEVRVIDSFKTLHQLEIDENSYMVILTRGHLFDRHVLEQVLRSGAAYVGMIGSHTKRDLTYDEMVAVGFTREELSRVFCPIGAAIGAETPEELAVSIVGELIKVRAGKNAPKKESSAVACCEVKAV